MPRTSIDPMENTFSSDPPRTRSETRGDAPTGSLKRVDKIRQSIHRSLDLSGKGHFAISGDIPSANNPGLYLKGLGSIDLSLSERDAKAIITVGHENSLSKGIKEPCDLSLQKRWELCPTLIEFRNPRWKETLQDIVEKTAEQLGFSSGEPNICNELRSLQLIGPGGCVDAIHEKEKVKGAFATLIITLPSAHEGGEIHAHLDDQKLSFSAPHLREFSYSYTACYTDIEHSIDTVISGYRLSLVYNLNHRGDTMEFSRPTSVLSDHKETMNGALAAWKTEVQRSRKYPKEILYTLENVYTMPNLEPRLMKEADQARCRYLYDACQNHGFCMFLARAEPSRRKACRCSNVYSDSGEESEDESSDWITVDQLFTPNGVLVARNLQLHKEALLQDTALDSESKYNDD